MPIAYRINVGGPEIAALDGLAAWQADHDPDSPYLITGSSYSANDNLTGGVGPSVPSSTPAEIFVDNRIAIASEAPPNMTWAFPVAPGTYDIRLYLGEYYFTSAQSRVFSFTVNGVTPAAFSDLDPYALFGADIGGMVSAQVTVASSDGAIELISIPIADNPMLYGIEILRVAGPARLSVHASILA